MLDLSSKPIKVCDHVIKRVRQRSRHNISKQFPDVSVINDIKHNMAGYVLYKRKGKLEIRIFAKGKRQYRIVEHNNFFKVITMIQHSEDSIKSAWYKSRGKRVVVRKEIIGF